MNFMLEKPSETFQGLDRLAILFLSLLLVFLLLLSIYHAGRIREMEEESGVALQQRVDLLTHLIGASLLEKEMQPSFDFMESQPGIRQVSFVDAQGKVLGDSAERVKVGRPHPSLGISSSEWERLLNGESLRFDVFREQSEEIVQAFFTPTRTPEGTVITRILIDRPNHGSTHPLKTLLWTYGLVASGVLGYCVLRVARKGGGAADSGGNTGMMVDAFHGLIARLKEKEEELQTLRYSAEKRAEEVENYNENILQSVTSGVITLDGGIRITTVNAAAESILCIKGEDILGKPGEAVFGKESQVLALLRQSVSTEAVMSRQELEMERSGGERIWVGISISLLRDRKENVIGTTLVFTDLTEIKRLQEQVESKKRLMVLGEMSAWIAHEFRNYMGTVFGFARLLSKKQSDDKQQAMIQSIMNELAAMDRLITELLSYGKKTEIHPQTVSLKEFVGEVVQPFETAGKFDGVHVEVTIPSSLPEISLDTTLMRQALSNLIQNALEALKDSSMPEERRLGILAWQSPSEVMIEVFDNGEGVPLDHLDKIFLPFYTSKANGTGLGLALVHKIVLSHNGRIETKNREKGGASFTVTLPLNGKKERWKPSLSSKIAKV